jgi:Ca2+-binding EF-hand superfamily protein
VEYAKIELVQRCLDFNLYDAFRVVDLGGRGYVTEKELFEAFQPGARHLVDDEVTGMDLPEVSPQEVTLFFIRYDKDRDGLLRFSEFTQAFLPLDDATSAVLEARNANPPGYPFSERTLYHYKSLWL